MTDVTRGTQSGGERLAFVFDTRRVKPSGLAGELVLSPEQMKGTDPARLHSQLARTPYAVAFISHGMTFILTTVHIVWGKGAKRRTPEVAAIADWLADWSGGDRLPKPRPARARRLQHRPAGDAN